MGKTNLFNEPTIEKIKKIKQSLFKVAKPMSVAELIFGIILFLINKTDLFTSQINLVILILIVFLFITINELSCITRGNKTAQIFAILGFVNNLICGFIIIASLLSPHGIRDSQRALLTLNHSILFLNSIWFLFVSNIMSIPTTIKAIKSPRDIAATSATVLWALNMARLNFEYNYNKVGHLPIDNLFVAFPIYAHIAIGSAIFQIALVVSIFSIMINFYRGRKNLNNPSSKDKATNQPQPNSSAEKEQVRPEISAEGKQIPAADSQPTQSASAIQPSATALDNLPSSNLESPTTDSSPSSVTNPPISS